MKHDIAEEKENKFTKRNKKLFPCAMPRSNGMIICKILAKGEVSMKFVTFNIRCDFGEDGINCFENRKQMILEKILNESPEILCFQEVVPPVAVWLKENLNDYYVIGFGRSATLEDEQLTIAYKKDRFNLIRMTTFWLSETPEIAGSRYEGQSECPRTCNEVIFDDLEEKRIFKVMNVHLDHIGVQAKIMGLNQLLDRQAEEKFMPDMPVIIAGDFNFQPESEEMERFKEHSAYKEFLNLTEGIGYTFHGFGEKGAEEEIDYIFVKGEVNVRSVVKWEDNADKIFLSDHYPVCAEFSFV